MDGEIVRAPGALGGEPTPNSQGYLIREEQRTRIRGRRIYQLQPGDTLLKISGGGAGVGDPAERDPEKVRWDVINKFVSLETAREIYKVAIDPKTLEIDLEKTRILRGQQT